MSRPHAALAAVPLCLVLVSGCLTSAGSPTSGGPAVGTSGSVGSGSSPAPLPAVRALYVQARASALAATSMRIVGSIMESDSQVSIDISGSVDGSNQQMVTEVPNMGKVTMRVVAGKPFIQLSAELVTSLGQDAVLKPYVGKWIAVPDAQAKSMGVTTMRSILEQMFADRDLSALDQVSTQVTQESVEGTPAYVLSDATGKSQAKVYVTADGRARLLKIVSTGASAGTLTVTDWDTVAAYPAPSGKDLVAIPGL